MNILFWLSKSRADRRGFCPIYTRITINGKRSEFSTGIKLKESEWDVKKNKVRGSSEFAIISNRKLAEIETDLRKVLMYRELQNLPISAKKIKELYLNPIQAITVLSIFDELVKEKESSAEAGNCSPRTPEKWRNFRRHLVIFLTKLKHKDLSIEELNIDIAKKFLHYLKTDANLVHNSAVKCARTLKTVIEKAIEKEHITVNKLRLWSLPNEKKPKSTYIFLTDRELSLIENYQFTSEALEKIADLFIFQCYAGFRYSDLETFDFEKDTFTYKGQIYLSKIQVKTSKEVIVPLFPKALEILEKYGMKLPMPAGKSEIISNAKYNKRLKEIAEIIGIDKHLTTHVARSTAGMKWKRTGISLDEVATMLGDNPETVRKHYVYNETETIHRATEKLRQS